MNVVPLTLTISLCLVFTFVLFFLREHARGHLSSAERDSLLPLAEETPALAHARAPHDSAAHGQCDCSDGSRAPCPGRLRREDVRSTFDPEVPSA
jgi:hypothetical protein